MLRGLVSAAIRQLLIPRRATLRALLLACASVLVLGAVGAPTAVALSAAQTYFAPLSAELIEGRQSPIAVPLRNGEVLIAGGSDNVTLRSAELFDPTTGTFDAIAGLTRHARAGAAAAPLPDGKVLIVGGSNQIAYTSGETFDPTTGTFSDVGGEMTTPRIGGIAAPLPGGKVLIAGGRGEGETLRTAEIFDEASGTFTALQATPVQGRSSAIAAALPDGRVLIAGGEGSGRQTAEIFDPTTDTFTAIGPSFAGPEWLAAGAALADGRVLIAGGDVRGGFATREAGIFDPGTGAYSPLPAEGDTELTTERNRAFAAPLPDGRILIGGGSWPEARRSAEVFVPSPAIGASGTDLGAVTIGQSSTVHPVSITNLGPQPLQIVGVTESGDTDGFGVLVDGCTGVILVFRQSCEIDVRFIPSAAGAAQATLAFDDNEPLPSTVALTGTGIEPAGPPASGSAQATVPPPPIPPRHGQSVGCQRKKLGPTHVRVICHLDLGQGNWDATLMHSGRAVASRQLGPGSHRVRFTRPPGRGGYRLLVVPSDAATSAPSR
jgi:hypothetical protein